ncbi:hypothetical protein NC651_014894 [Populus alba x Populus x berolinensis]|nr:hypothetical protein NC651_014894 [Populus alba x Populus x berolinensis]
MASITVLLEGMQEELPFLMALCVAYWKMKIVSRDDKSNCLRSDHKLLLWQCLKKKRDVVALIVANNLHDTPALRRAADIGLVEADRGTRMARDHL